MNIKILNKYVSDGFTTSSSLSRWKGIESDGVLAVITVQSSIVSSSFFFNMIRPTL